MTSILMNVLVFLAPPTCVFCGESGFPGLCPRCRKKLDRLFDPHSFRCTGGNGYADGMYALFHYDCAPVRSLLFDLKRFGYQDSLDAFSVYLKQAAARDDFPEETDFVTFCPCTPAASGKRGFDQSLLLAERVAEILKKPAKRLLTRSAFARVQHRLSAEERRENAAGTFQSAQNLYGENILLIDDVVTTGATADEAARILKSAGAMRVFVLCLAH